MCPASVSNILLFAIPSRYFNLQGLSFFLFSAVHVYLVRLFINVLLHHLTRLRNFHYLLEIAVSRKVTNS